MGLFERGSILSRFALAPLGRSLRFLPRPLVSVLFLAAALTMAAALLRHQAVLAAGAIVAYLVLVPAALDEAGSILAQRRFYLMRRVLESLVMILAGHAAGNLPLGLCAAISCNVFPYSAISLVVEIPSRRRESSPETVKAMNRLFFATPYPWPVGEEFAWLALAAGLSSGHEAAALWIVIASPLLLVPQWIAFWRSTR